MMRVETREWSACHRAVKMAACMFCVLQRPTNAFVFDQNAARMTKPRFKLFRLLLSFDAMVCFAASRVKTTRCRISRRVGF